MSDVPLERSGGSGAAELNAVHKLVEENAADFREAWNEFFGQ